MDPVIIPTEPHSALAHAAETAGSGGFIATLLAFFQSRDRAALRDRVAALEAEVAALRVELDSIAPRRLKKRQRQR